MKALPAILVICLALNLLNHSLAINASSTEVSLSQEHNDLTADETKNIEEMIKKNIEDTEKRIKKFIDGLTKVLKTINTFYPYVVVFFLIGTIIGCIIFPCVMMCLGCVVGCVYCSEKHVDRQAAKDLESGNGNKDVDKKKVSKDMTTAKTTKTTADDAESKDNVVPPASNNNGVAVETIIHRPMV